MTVFFCKDCFYVFPDAVECPYCGSDKKEVVDMNGPEDEE